jgi:hypothetical protein
MPAIELARLKTQAARLADKFGDPEDFLRDLNELLDYYTNRTIRASQTIQRLAAPTYHTPRPVLRQIEGELSVLAESRPSEAVTMTKAMWEAGSLESRQLAAYLLGSIPSEQARPLLTSLEDWLTKSTDKEIQAALLTTALTRLRREKPDEFFRILEDWLNSPQPTQQVWGMRAMIPLFQDPQFQNLPAVFRILRPAIQRLNPATQLDFQACLAALEGVSFTETVAFLREIIRATSNPLILRIFRRILPGLSPKLQEALREILRAGYNQTSLS